MLQNPWSEKDLFKGLGQNCPYDLTILRAREEVVNDPDYKIHIGDFEWTNGLGSPVKWVDNPLNGKWHVAYLFDDPRKANQVYKVDGPAGTSYKPKNTINFKGGFDPTREGKDENKRRSTAAGTIYMEYTDWLPDISGNWIADYQHTPHDPATAWDDFLIGCFYYGCQFLPEKNLGVPKTKYQGLGVYDFIMWRPRTTFTVKGNSQMGEGIHANEQTNEYQLRKKKSHIVNYGHKMVLPRTLADTIAFDPSKRTKHDLEVASQLSLVATEQPVEEFEEAMDATFLIPLYDNHGEESKMK